jgi:hypothetical protein
MTVDDEYVEDDCAACGMPAEECYPLRQQGSQCCPDCGHIDREANGG